MNPLKNITSKITEISHFSHHIYLKQTAFKVLPDIAASIGKRAFKKCLAPLIKPLVLALQSPYRLAARQAGICIERLAALLGGRILMGRIIDEDTGGDERFRKVVERSTFVTSVNWAK